jgi:3-(3-hydroxy-phenyl)propionate hydroxylase
VNSELNTSDAEEFAGNMVPGAPLDDAPVRVDGQDAWLLDQLGNRFVLLAFADPSVPDGESSPEVVALKQQAQRMAAAPIPVHVLWVTAQEATAGDWRSLQDKAGLATQRMDASPGSVYLIRPDQHVAARWRAFDPASVAAAVARATGQHLQPAPARAAQAERA